MEPPIDLAPAAARMRQLAGGVSADQMDGPTPCEGWTVRDLVAHVVGLTHALRLSAEKRPLPPADEAPTAAEVVDDGGAWRERLDRQLDALVAAWRQPEAWDGTSEAGGVTLPAEVMGQVVVDELVLHGWDVAVSTGQPFDVDDASLDAVLAFTTAMSEPGDEASRDGLFGPVVPVPSDDRSPAAPFDRALRLSGRRPDWTP